LTERRDAASLDGIEGTEETGTDLGFSGSEPVTSGFEGVPKSLDAEQVSYAS
jgi:hypothetical protein